MSMSLKYEPSSAPPHISAKQLFSDTLQPYTINAETSNLNHKTSDPRPYGLFEAIAPPTILKTWVLQP